MYKRQTFDFGLNVVADSADSMLAVAAGWISPVFAPLAVVGVLAAVLAAIIARL